MKVLLVHNFYRSTAPSGEDVVYRNEKELLRSHGVEVVTYERANDDITGKNRLMSAFSMIWSSRSYKELKALIARERPDVAHFHNIWYLISPSAYYACKDAGLPVIQTLHNFRMFCTNGLLLRDGRTCEACIGRTPWRGVAYGCYRNSRVYSLPVALAEAIHKTGETWSQHVDAFLSLTEFGKRKFLQCGLPEDKIFVKPNFISTPPIADFTHDDYAVFIGRLSGEKGLQVLIEAAKYIRSGNSGFRLKIIGDGPLRKQAEIKVRADQTLDIEFTGRKTFFETMEILKSAGYLVMPAICYENFPMTIIEAFACGKPVIASDLGAMAAIVEHGKTGLLFDPGNAQDLSAKMQWMLEHRDACMSMGRNARIEFDSKYTAERNFRLLMDIYEAVLCRTA